MPNEIDETFYTYIFLKYLYLNLYKNIQSKVAMSIRLQIVSYFLFLILTLWTVQFEKVNGASAMETKDEDEGGIICRGKKKTLDPTVAKVFQECRTQVIESHRPYFECQIACRGKKYGIFKEGEPWDMKELGVLVTRMYLPEMIPLITQEFFKCAQPTASQPYKEEQDCGQMVHMVRCVRDVIYRECLVPSEDMVNSHTGKTVDKLVTYSTCKNTVLTHSPRLVKSYRDCASDRQQHSAADVYRCLYESTGIVTKDGDLNETMISVTWGPSFVSEKLNVEKEEFFSTIINCYKELGPIGKYKEEEHNAESAPFFACVHREFFRICRPGQHVVAFGNSTLL